MRWAQSWSRSTGSLPAGDFLSNLQAIGCHYFLQGLRSPSQLKNVTILWLVPSYTAWWQWHVGVNNLPKVAMQPCPRWESNPRRNDHKSKYFCTAKQWHHPTVIVCISANATNKCRQDKKGSIFKLPSSIRLSKVLEITWQQIPGPRAINGEALLQCRVLNTVDAVRATGYDWPTVNLSSSNLLRQWHSMNCCTRVMLLSILLFGVIFYRRLTFFLWYSMHHDQFTSFVFISIYQFGFVHCFVSSNHILLGVLHALLMLMSH